MHPVRCVLDIDESASCDWSENRTPLTRRPFDYSLTGSWDVCVTCFFLDTARNVVEYLETIHGLLKPGGLWINCGELHCFPPRVCFEAKCHLIRLSPATGPTLWHFENDRDASSLELPLEDVKAVARKIGFEISVRFSAALPSHFFSLCLPERLSDLAPLVAG